jgi:hypothetical protein
MERNLDNKKTLTPVQIIDTSAGLNSKNIEIVSVLKSIVFCRNTSCVMIPSKHFCIFLKCGKIKGQLFSIIVSLINNKLME